MDAKREGRKEGHAESRIEGRAEEHRNNVEKLADNYLSTNVASNKAEAIKMAEAILGKI